MHNPFTHHPASVDESYLEHMGMASGFAATLAVATLTAAIHAILPFMFEKTASRLIDQLHARMVRNRHHKSDNTSQIPSLDWQI